MPKGKRKEPLSEETPKTDRMPQPNIPGANYNGMYNGEDFKDWIVKAEAGFAKVREYYEQDREYFENVQEPSDVPTDKTYIVENRLVDLNRRLSGQIVSGKVNPSLKGGGDMMVPVAELFIDIFDENKFKEHHLENITNHIYCEGYAGFKFRYNPRKVSKYGIGKPEIFSLMSDELWLDPDSRDLMHTDDVFRIHPQRMLVKEAWKRWPEKKEEISTSHNAQTTSDNPANDYADIYDLEFKETFFVEVNSIKIEIDRYFIVKIANQTVILEGPEPTGYPLFRLIPVIHTPRKSHTYGKYPYGPNRLLGQTQDQLNIISSVMTEAVKHDIKNLTFLTGVKDTEAAEFETEAGKTNGLVRLFSPSAKVTFAPKTGLAPSLIQLYDIINHRFDRIQGDFAPSRGEIKGNLSGVTVNQLVTQGIMSEFVALSHLESAVTDLGRCVLHCIKMEMNTPFIINRRVEGKEKKIPFNVPAKAAPDEKDDYMVQGVNGVNTLSDINMDVSLEIEMNHEQKRQADIQLAIIAHDRQKLSTDDFLKALFPKTWQEKSEKLLKENQALALVKELAELGPEAVDYVRNVVIDMKGKMMEVEKGMENQQGQPGQSA